jgi:hypothetical protein
LGSRRIPAGGPPGSTFPTTQPITDYLDSVHHPVQRTVGEPFDFDAVLTDIARREEHTIDREGSFKTHSRAGVFACR